MSRLRLDGVTARPLLAGAGVVLLLGAVAAGVSALGFGGTASSSVDPDWVVDVVVAAAVVAIVVGIVLVVLGWRTELERGSLRYERPRWWILRMAATLVLVMSVFGLARGALHPQPVRQDPDATAGDLRRANRGGEDQPRPDGWVVMAIAGPVLVALGVMAWRRRDTRSLRPAPEPNDVVALAALESLDVVLAEPDPRAAVMKAYLHMEAVLARAGVARHPWEAPFEYLDRVFESLGAPTAVAATLTELYERAKFSQHPVGPEMREAAIAALRSLSAELEEVR